MSNQPPDAAGDDAAGRWQELQADDLTDREVAAIRASQAHPDTPPADSPRAG